MLAITPSFENNAQPAFGIKWTKSTVRFLKRSAPQLIEDNGFQAAKEGINNLIRLGKRNDGITAKINGEDIGEFFIAVKNDKIDQFLYGEMQDSIGLIRENSNNSLGELLKTFSEYISGNNFLETSKDTIKRYINHRNKISNNEKIKEFFEYNVFSKLADIKENIMDALSLVVCTTKKGREYIIPNFIDELAENFSSVKPAPLEKQQIKELKNLINQMRPKTKMLN